MKTEILNNQATKQPSSAKKPVRLALLLLCSFVPLLLNASPLTNVITGNVGDYSLNPLKRVTITITKLSPIPGVVGNTQIRNDSVATVSDAAGNYAFTNLQWGYYSGNIQGLSGTPFKFNVWTNTLGTVPIGSLITNIGAFPPNPATNYYTQAQTDALLAGNLTSAEAIAKMVVTTNESGTASYLVITNTAIHHNIDLPAMLNALPHATNRMYPGGGTIELGQGIYYTSGALYTNYTGVDTVVIRGKGVVQTCLIFTNNTGLTLQGNGNNLSLILQGVTVASIVDSNYFLVHLQNNNRSAIEDCTFGFWPHMTNGIGLEVGVAATAISATGLGGVWYDGTPTPLGTSFLLARNNFNALAIGAYLDANHPRLEDNFFEADNCDGDAESPGRTSNWPAPSPLSLGGAVFLGPRISSFSGRGNHWFRCVNPIVDLRQNAANEVTFHDNEFELSGGGILMITNGTAALTLDGITWGEPNPLLYEFNSVSGYALSATSFDAQPNPNYRTRIAGNYRGNYNFQNLSGNGAGITNLVSAAQVAKQFAITNESRTARFVITTNTENIHNIDLQAIFKSLPHATSSTYPGGGTIELGEGIYYCSGAMWTNYAGVDSITIKGKGIVQTCLVFTNNSGLWFQGKGNNIGVNLEGLTIASMVDSNYFLVHIQNNNRSTIHDCTFVSWRDTNSYVGEVGIPSGSAAFGGLGGVWYDGFKKDGTRSFGDCFTVEDCNFNLLAIGLVLDGDHARFNNNFFEGCNYGAFDDPPPPPTSTWPRTNAFGLGGALIIGVSDVNFSMEDVRGDGNHFFSCINPIVDMRAGDSIDGQIVLTSMQIELCIGGILFRTNANPNLYLDGLTFDPTAIDTRGIETNTAREFIADVGPIHNPNYRQRITGHYQGAYTFDSLSSTNYTGDGSALTNLSAAALASGTVPLARLPVEPFGNLRFSLGGSALYAGGSAYDRLTNFNQFASNNFTGDPGQGTMTNTIAGWYRESATITVKTSNDSNPVYVEGFFTNGVLAGVEIENNFANQFAGGNVDLMFPDSGQFFFLPAGTRCEWKVKQVLGTEAYNLQSATITLQYKP